MIEFYDWDKTYSYDADVTMVVGARGYGKTFGWRKSTTKRDIKLTKEGNDRRFTEIVRYKSQLSMVSDNYFSRLSREPELRDYVFRTDARYMFWADRPSNKNKKPDWYKLGYFVAMTDYQTDKTRTFDYVDRLLMDECILDRQDRFHRYLPNEVALLANIVDTVTRERADIDGLKPHVYLLGNAVDISNPYFAHYGVGSDLEYGYRWYHNKTFLLHFVESSNYSREKSAGTVAGRMLDGMVEGRENVQNIFHNISTEFVYKKPKNAKFLFAIILDGDKFGIWCDYLEGYYYVTDWAPNSNDKPVYALSYADYRINYIAVNRLHQVLRGFMDVFWAGLIRYDNLEAKRKFFKVLELLGVK